MILDGTQPASIAATARAVRSGALLGLPTETVYGLAADASSDAAVAQIFAAKGRPSDHPLIVHVTDAQAAQAFAADRRPDKRVQLVRALLARDVDYADHWMVFWNDLLRNDYAGTGYIDGGRKQITNWLYLSLLANKPYDRFTRELVAPSTDSEGFAKGIIWRGAVSAAQMPELQYSQSVSQTFLGINMKCASCHDSFIDTWKLEDAYSLAAVIANSPLEINRCDKPQGRKATAAFLFPQLGTIDASLPRDKRLLQTGKSGNESSRLHIRLRGKWPGNPRAPPGPAARGKRRVLGFTAPGKVV